VEELCPWAGPNESNRLPSCASTSSTFTGRAHAEVGQVADDEEARSRMSRSRSAMLGVLEVNQDTGSSGWCLFQASRARVVVVAREAHLKMLRPGFLHQQSERRPLPAGRDRSPLRCV